MGAGLEGGRGEREGESREHLSLSHPAPLHVPLTEHAGPWSDLLLYIALPALLLPAPSSWPASPHHQGGQQGGGVVLGEGQESIGQLLQL